MMGVSYAKRGLRRGRLSIDDVLSPNAYWSNFAVFGGSEDERIRVMVHGIYRNINRQAVIVLHDSVEFERAMMENYRPVTRIDVSDHSFDPLFSVDRNDAIDTRNTLRNVVGRRGIAIARVPSGDAALQEMMASELLGLSHSGLPFLLVLFGIRQTGRDPLIQLMLGDHGENYICAISGSSSSRTVSAENISDMLQSYQEILFLPTEDIQEAQRISNSFGTYMRSAAIPNEHSHGIWPFRRTSRGVSYQQTQTNNINPQALRQYSLVCGTAFREPVLVKQIDLKRRYRA